MERKLIRIKNDELLNCTFEELLIRFDGIIGSYMKKFNFLCTTNKVEKEDLRQELEIALWKAYVDFNIEKPYIIGSYFKNRAYNVARKYFIYNERQKRKGKKCSLNTFVDDNEEEELIGGIPDNKAINPEKEIVYKELNENIMKHLTKKQKEVLQYRLLGYTDAEIGKITKKSRQAICQTGDRIEERVQKYFNEEKRLNEYELQ